MSFEPKKEVTIKDIITSYNELSSIIENAINPTLTKITKVREYMDLLNQDFVKIKKLLEQMGENLIAKDDKDCLQEIINNFIHVGEKKIAASQLIKEIDKIQKENLIKIQQEFMKIKVIFKDLKLSQTKKEEEFQKLKNENQDNNKKEMEKFRNDLLTEQRNFINNILNQLQQYNNINNSIDPENKTASFNLEYFDTFGNENMEELKEKIIDNLSKQNEFYKNNISQMNLDISPSTYKIVLDVNYDCANKDLTASSSVHPLKWYLLTKINCSQNFTYSNFVWVDESKIKNINEYNYLTDERIVYDNSIIQKIKSENENIKQELDSAYKKVEKEMEQNNILTKKLGRDLTIINKKEFVLTKFAETFRKFKNKVLEILELYEQTGKELKIKILFEDIKQIIETFHQTVKEPFEPPKEPVKSPKEPIEPLIDDEFIIPPRDNFQEEITLENLILYFEMAVNSQKLDPSHKKLLGEVLMELERSNRF